MSNSPSKGTALITGDLHGHRRRLCRPLGEARLRPRPGGPQRGAAQGALWPLTSETGRSVTPLRADLTDKADLAKVESLLRSDQTITMLVNNAGIGSITPLLNTDVDNVDDMIALNIIALTRLTYAAAPAFVARGVGTIITIASVVGISPETLEYYRDLFEQAEVEWETRATVEWVATYGRQIDNVRAALDWAFSRSGDASIGAALTAASVPLWFQYSLMVECRGRVERALASLEPRSGRGGRREMQLFAALGVSLMQTKGPAPDTTAAWTTALEIAERVDDIEYQLRALWGLWHFRVSRGECRAALALAESFCGRVAGNDNPAELLVGERMVGVSLHYLGDQTNARRHLEHMLSRYVAPAHRSHAIRFQYDQQVASRMILARILWLQGFPDQALWTAQENVEDARAIDHALSLCYALEAACLVPLWIGDLPAAERFVAMLLDHSARHALTVWHARGRCLNGALLIKRAEVGGGLPLLRDALDELRETGFVPHHTALLGTLAQGLAWVGQVAQGLATIDEALTRSERDEEHWCIAELLRIKGELVLLAGGPGAAPAAEEHFQHALRWTRQQGILSMELRCAAGLARLWHAQGQTEPARELLAPIYGRFIEGFGTADLRAAKELLDSFG